MYEINESSFVIPLFSARPNEAPLSESYACHFISKKAKGQISKLMLQGNKVQRKLSIYPLIGTRTCAYQCVRNVETDRPFLPYYRVF